VAEEDAGLLVYLIFLSRLLPEPGSVITRGPSGSGKTTLLRVPARLVPSGCKIEAMATTPAAWFNTERDYFMNKVFLAGERKHAQDDKTRDANAMLRQLISEGRINRGVSVFNKEEHKWETVFVEREGPVAYAESTTCGTVFEEDLNRMVQIYVDDSEDQNRRVMRAMAAGCSRAPGGTAGPDVGAIIKRHHEFQTRLQAEGAPPIEVPFAPALAEAMPAGRVECRRAFAQVLTVIKAVVLLNRHRRLAPDGGLLATLDDYALARRLLLGPLHAALGAGKGYKDYEAFERLRAGVRKDVFTAADVRRALGFDNDMGPSRLLRGLVDAGLVVLLTVPKGRTPATYRWAGKDGPDPESMVLPPVEGVRAALSN
jgi:hypothetical protein